MNSNSNDKFTDECGVFGIWNSNDFDTAEIIYLAMHGIQHRGQQSAGIAVNDSGKIFYHKELGLVPEVFNDVVLRHLHGYVGLGHVGYNPEEENARDNGQPLVIRYTKGQMAISYNGCLLNANDIRAEFEDMGHMFRSFSDAEVIATLVSRERIKCSAIEDAVYSTMKLLKGSYSFLIMTPHKLIAARDPYGLRPLCLGKLNDSYIFSSETSALDTIGAEFIRDVRPGEIIVIQDGNVKSIDTKLHVKTAMCIFEFVYLARNDSTIDGANVYQARYEMGRILAEEHPCDADLVIGVPDSGIAAALGYAKGSGLPYAEGLIKNRYIGRTFIQSSQDMRERAVSLKLNALRSQIEGKKIVLVDDSIVRGTTSKKIVQLLRENGKAKEIHMRISSPPVRFSCKYGIDTPDEGVLIANSHSNDEICQILGIDSLGFISLDGLLKSPINVKCGFCSACFDGNYPIQIEEE